MDAKKVRDPQLVVTGRLKRIGEENDVIVFTVRLALFELVCIVNIPFEDQETAPVYVKFRVNTPYNQRQMPPVEYANSPMPEE